jgi:hypothetical protein
MLANIQNGFRNSQGDNFPQAVIVIEDAEYAIEKVESKRVSIKRTQAENYDTEERQEADNYEGIGGEVRFTAKYWTQLPNFQQGKKGYWLEGAGDNIEFIIDINDEWAEKFNAIQGTDTQKITKLCEMYISEVVLPELRAM